MKIYSFLIRPGWNFLKPEFPQRLHLKISNHTHVKKVGHALEFLFGIYWWSWKTTIYLKKLLKWANKKTNSFNIYNVAFFFLKKRKTPGDIIILHLCTKNLNDMIYSSWNIERDGLKLVILGNFSPFYSPKDQKNYFRKNFEKMKKIIGDIIILLMCTKNHNHMMYGSWDFLSLLVIFCSFTPRTTRKIKILNNWKSTWRYYFTYVHHKWQSYSCMVPDIWSATNKNFLSFWTVFCPFTPLTTHKIKILLKRN